MSAPTLIIILCSSLHPRLYIPNPCGLVQLFIISYIRSDSTYLYISNRYILHWFIWPLQNVIIVVNIIICRPICTEYLLIHTNAYNSVLCLFDMLCSILGVHYVLRILGSISQKEADEIISLDILISILLL